MRLVFLNGVLQEPMKDYAISETNNDIKFFKIKEEGYIPSGRVTIIDIAHRRNRRKDRDLRKEDLI